MSAHQACYPVATMCRVREVFPSGYHAWLGRWPSKRAQEDVRLRERIEMIHARSRGTTKRDPEAEPAADLVEREFTAPAPDRLWVGDITYIPTGEGTL